MSIGEIDHSEDFALALQLARLLQSVIEHAHPVDRVRVTINIPPAYELQRQLEALEWIIGEAAQPGHDG